MRPLELTLEGFKSYRRAQTFSFESRTLFGIAGPTGSGKSSILEGMFFALFGKTPSVGSNNKKLINSQEARARVQLIFDVDDIAWVVSRSIRIKGPSETVLRRHDGSGETYMGDREVTEKVEEIVGLDFELFRSAVSLPQGEFDRFLKAGATERSQILKAIFRLGRIDQLRSAAKGKRQTLEGRIGEVNRTLQGFPEDPEQLLVILERDATAAQATADEVREELPAVLHAEREVERSQEEIKRLEEAGIATKSALRRLPPEESLRSLSDAHERAELVLDGARTSLAEADLGLEAAFAEETRVLEETGGETWVNRVESALKDVERLKLAVVSAKSALAQLEKTAEEREEALPAAAEALRLAEAGSEEAGRQLRELHQQHSAHVLRLELNEGAPCPVCEQLVTEIPGSQPLQALDIAEREVAEADSALRRASSEFHSAQREHDLAQERLKVAAAAASIQETELLSAGAELAELAPGLEDVGAETAVRRQALNAMRSALQKARSAREEADATERQARKDFDKLAERTREITRQLDQICGLLNIPAAPDGDDPLWETAKRVLEAGATRVEELSRQSAGLEALSRKAAQRLESFRVRFDAALSEHASDVHARFKAQVARLQAKVEELKAGMEKRRAAQLELAALVAGKDRLDLIVGDFTDAKFTAYLLDEHRQLLSRIGSEKLLELTGHYTFDAEGKFEIFDQRNGKVRTPDTLSGGETFLASLSLALALSEAVALEGGRLGCFFLDEGFGSLDQESLDLAMDGIESLAVPGRLIGLISHVTGVQQRLDDVIILERLPDGSTEVAQEEGPIGFASTLI